jgi:hypothetical protein
MITTRHMHAEVEFVRWLLLALAAIALVLAAATLAAAGDPTIEPRLLPGDMMDIAKPLAVAPVHQFTRSSQKLRRHANSLRRKLPPACGRSSNTSVLAA